MNELDSKLYHIEAHIKQAAKLTNELGIKTRESSLVVTKLDEAKHWLTDFRDWLSENEK